MPLSSLPGPLEVIRRHPPLTAELARRFTPARLPDPVETFVELLTTQMSVLMDGQHVPAIETAVYRTSHPDAAARAEALTVRVAAQNGVCWVMYSVGTNAEVSTPVAIG